MGVDIDQTFIAERCRKLEKFSEILWRINFQRRTVMSSVQNNPPRIKIRSCIKYLFKSIFFGNFLPNFLTFTKADSQYFHEACCQTGRLSRLVQYYILNREVQLMGFYVTRIARHERVNV